MEDSAKMACRLENPAEDENVDAVVPWSATFLDSPPEFIKP